MSNPVIPLMSPIPLMTPVAPVAPAAPAPIPKIASSPAEPESESLSTAATPAQESAALTAEQLLAALADQPAVQANAVTAVVGDSGSGKTSLIATAAEYNWETFHRITRIYVGDPGGYGNKILSLVRLGIVQVWNLVNHHEPFETVELASMGYWPERILNAETGYADPFVTLVPPQRRRYTVYCQRGHALPPVDDKRVLAMYQAQCPTCKEIVTLQNLLKIEETVTRSKGFKHVGLWAYESGSALSDHAMNDMAERAGRDELGGEKGAINKIISGGMTFGANNRAHYGFAQIRVRQWLLNSRRIPGQVVPPIWSFLLDRGSDEKNSPVYGPKIAGTAKTAEIPGWVGNCFHCEKAKDERTGLDVWRLWTTGHRNAAEGNVLYLAKHRGEPGALPPYLQDDPDKPFEKFSLGYVFRAIDASFQSSLKRDAQKYPDAPALHPFVDHDEEEVIVSTPMATGSLQHMAPPSPSVGGVPLAMVPGAVGGVVPLMMAPVMNLGAGAGMAPAGSGGVVAPPGARPIIASVVAAPASLVAPAVPVASAAPATIPTPKGPVEVPASLLPFTAAPGDPPVMAPAAAPVRPPMPSRT